MDFTSRYEGRTSLRLEHRYGGRTSRVIFTKSIIKQEHAENIHKRYMNYLQYFKAISIEISEHHEANSGFDSGPQRSRQAVSTYLSGSGQYSCWYGVATNQVVEV